jgi:hypothetical protein
MLGALFSLLAEAPEHPNLWNPTILGILTAVCAVGLFCGSVYLLLGTNLGARLGFLVAAAGLTGFMVLLTLLWWTSGSSGIDPPHGRSPAWEVVDVVAAPPESKVEAVRGIADGGRALDAEALDNLRPAIDAALVPAESLHGETPEPRPFATLGFSDTTDFIVDFEGFESFETGGGTKNVFWHTPEFAAVQLCSTAKSPQGEVLVPPRCDPLQPTQYVILEHDLGTLRQPVILYFFMSLALFALSLLGLHWYELDARERRRAGLAPVPTPGG